MKVSNQCIKNQCSTRFPLATGIQPVSRGWIGLDAKVRRGDTPIRQVILEYITKTNELQISPHLSYTHPKRRAIVS